MDKSYLFESTVKIRDFECDMQGVVNNAYYHNLLMQTRSEFLESIGIDQKEWSSQRGIDFVVYKTMIQYKSPIFAGETFKSCLNLHRENARFVFTQDFRRENGELCMRARVDVIVGLNGRLTRGMAFANYLHQHNIRFDICRSHLHDHINGAKTLKNVVYTYEMKVRDYECDRTGTATNAFIQSYLEVTRLEFMEDMGETFKKWHDNGIDLMVSKVDLHFIKPMEAAQKFNSLMNIRQEGPRIVFEQQLRRKADNKLCIRACVDIVGIVNGQLDSEGTCFREFMSNVDKRLG